MMEYEARSFIPRRSEFSRAVEFAIELSKRCKHQGSSYFECLRDNEELRVKTYTELVNSNKYDNLKKHH